MSDTTLTDPASQILRIPAGTAEDCARAIEALKVLQDVVKERRALLEAALIDWIELNGELEINDNRYWVGPDKDEKCRDKKKTLYYTLDSTGGDLDAVVDYMVAQPWKPGALKPVLKERWDECFEVLIRDKLKEGKPQKRLQQTNTRFLPSRKEQTDAR